MGQRQLKGRLKYSKIDKNNEQLFKQALLQDIRIAGYTKRKKCNVFTQYMVDLQNCLPDDAADARSNWKKKIKHRTKAGDQMSLPENYHCSQNIRNKVS